MAFKKKTDLGNVSPFKFEKKGDSITGYYLKTDSIQIEGKDVKRHVFQTSEGIVGVLGQQNLGSQLSDVPTGTMVKAVLLGIQKLPRNRTLKVYEVHTDDEDVMDQDAVESSAAFEGEDANTDEDLDTEGEAETDLDSEEQAVDEIKPARAKPPVQAAKAPDASRKAQVAALLSKGRAKSA